MKVTLDEKTIQTITLFQNMTGSSVIDCIDNEELYFVVAQGNYGLAIGKNGTKIKHAEKMFKKPIKIYEYAPDLKEFIKNMIPGCQEITVEDNNVFVKVKQFDRARIIGKSGKNIKIIGNFLERLFDIASLKVK